MQRSIARLASSRCCCVQSKREVTIQAQAHERSHVTQQQCMLAPISLDSWSLPCSAIAVALLLLLLCPLGSSCSGATCADESRCMACRRRVLALLRSPLQARQGRRAAAWAKNL